MALLVAKPVLYGRLTPNARTGSPVGEVPREGVRRCPNLLEGRIWTVCRHKYETTTARPCDRDAFRQPRFAGESDVWLDRCDPSAHWVTWAWNRIVQVRETYGSLDDFEEILGKLEQYGHERVRPTGPATYRQDY